MQSDGFFDKKVAASYDRMVLFRYAWPAEMDLMARLSGLEREHRWADWTKTPYTCHSTSHISVWKKPKD